MGHISDRETRSIVNLRLGSETRNMIRTKDADPKQEALSERVAETLTNSNLLKILQYLKPFLNYIQLTFFTFNSVITVRTVFSDFLGLKLL